MLLLIIIFLYSSWNTIGASLDVHECIIKRVMKNSTLSVIEASFREIYPAEYLHNTLNLSIRGPFISSAQIKKVRLSKLLCYK